MEMVSIDRPDTIQELVTRYSRFNYLVTETYGIRLEEITQVHVDGDNKKVDLVSKETTYRFKFKGPQHALVPDPESPGTVKMVLDPALAQAIFEIIDDYAK